MISSSKPFQDNEKNEKEEDKEVKEVLSNVDPPKRRRATVAQIRQAMERKIAELKQMDVTKNDGRYWR